MATSPTRTRLHLVCSPLGSVGKTLTARLLLDRAWRANPRARGFDTNHIEPDLAWLYPITATAVDLSSTRGQMELFDQLVVPDGTPKIVDLWHATYDQFWAQADALGFFHEAMRQNLEVVVFLQADRKDRFINEMRALPQTRPNLRLVLVHNLGLMETPASDQGRVAILGAKRLLTVPAFDAVLRQVLETPGSLANKMSLIAAKTGPDDADRHALLKRVFDQMSFLELSMGRAG